VHVGDVVKRIKCDLAKIIFTKAQERTPDGRTPFEFLAYWAAKIHLTITIDASVGVNPGATITTPLDKTVATALIPATTELFSLGLGAGLTTEAVRTEDIEFLMSFPEIITEFQKPSQVELYNGCQFDNGLLLESDLDLGSLVDSALEPIKTGVLYQGNNVGPGPAPVAIPDSQLKNIAKTLADVSKMIVVEKKDEAVPPKSDSQEKARIAETQTQAIINNIVKPLYTIASTSLDPSCLTKITQSQYEAIASSANVSLNVIKVDDAKDPGAALNRLKDVQDARTKVVNFAMEMVSEIRACKAQAKKPQQATPQYDPIDVISETVTFNVTASGNVTPMWKLVKITTPLAPTFLSGSRKDTNLLVLAMGRPDVSKTTGAITSTNAMDRQILAAILGQAIASQRLGP
jgi:hypothetical protein